MKIFNQLRTALTSLISKPERWLVEWFGGGSQAKSGVVVNEETALQVTAVWACVRLLSETVAALPLNLLKYTDRGKERATNHPLYFLLHNEPNSEQTSFDFIMVLMVNLLLCGRAFAEVVKNDLGQVVELWNIPTGNVTIRRNAVTKELMYDINVADARHPPITLYPENIVDIRGMSFNGVDTFKPAVAAREAIGLSLATEEFGARFFGNGTNLGGVVEYEGKLSEPAKERFKKDVSDKYEGLGKSNRLLFLENGSKFTKVNTTPNDSQFIETRKFQVIEIARFFNVPPHLIMDLERATFSNIEHQSLSFVIYSLMPWLVRIEQAFQKSCLAPGEKKKYLVKFNVAALLRGDYASRMAGYAVGRQNGWMSANDIRELEDQNLIAPEQGGDDYLVNGNMIPAKLAGTQNTGANTARALELANEIRKLLGGGDQDGNGTTANSGNGDGTQSN